MYITVNGVKHQIVFNHLETKLNKRTSKGTPKIRRETLAIARPPKDRMKELPVYTQVSICHPSDAYDRMLGRRIAFGRLLATMTCELPEEQALTERKAAWFTYFSETKDGKVFGLPTTEELSSEVTVH